MATPPSGYPYAHGQPSEPRGETPPKRYNFPSAPSRQARSQQQPEPPQQPRPPRRQPQQPQQQPYTPSYAPPGPSEGSWYDAPPAPRIQPVQPPERLVPEPSPAGGAHNPLVRPYAMTGGRTRPRYQLAIEALVHTTADPAQLQGQLPEHQRICQLCREIKSVAEISALLTIPLGVARILVADLAEAGLVAIHQPGGDESAGGQPDVTLLERVLSGLRKL
ncbi:DUF742 domain-containing protein [Streptomyces sp. NPDC044780]|uniref:DUF742 domain-containing protein n=1 Tax=Streptomyces luomodiensis TaxID=3026192 RepID=A0ABY9V507_9ACTN|nr:MULTISPECIES: DUF742 domain-containing protein [unclassified Streptomyces]WAP58514.1 DUF742 domain-containing protein [Streptomyces sp. S465]WNE99090.1 DUF742 domain-containing protein [Streptomyces sp. SCA4-21]